MCMGPVWLTTHKDLLNSVYATWTLRIAPMAMETRTVSGVTTLSLKILLVDFIGLKKYDDDDDDGGDDDNVMMKAMIKRVKRSVRKLPLSRVLSDDGVQPLIDTRSAFSTF